MKTRFLFILTTLIFTINAAAEEIRIASAANFISPIKEITKVFNTMEKEIKASYVSGSTGVLSSQIQKGAPFDIFLAADTMHPESLKKKGFCRTTFLYAKGETVLWTGLENMKGKRDWKEVVENSAKISFPMPSVAPYGKSAENILKRENLYDKYKEKFIFTKNVGLSFQYANLKLTDSGFCSLSQALSKDGKNGIFFHMDSEPVVQGGCMIKESRAVYTFMNFFTNSKESKKIIEKYGYKIP